MRQIILLLLLLFFSGGVAADSVWRGTNSHSFASAAGDLLTTNGATVALSAESIGKDGFVGAITSVDARAFIGQEVVLSGTLLVRRGPGVAALWVRADGPEGRLAFETSQREPVRINGSPQARNVRLYVPVGATSLKLGITLDSAGNMEARGLSLRSERVNSDRASAYEMLDIAISTISVNALNAGRVDWSAERERSLTSDLKHLPAQEAYSRIQKLLTALEDRHSFVLPPENAASYRANAIATRAIEAREIKDIGYLLVPGLRGTAVGESGAFSDQLCQQVSRLAPAASAGWIIDLRANTGGNMWPMINGLRPLLGDAGIGAFRDRDGVSTPWRSRLSAACVVDLSKSPVAVIVGPKTASSGEAVAVAFRARPNTRFFGQPTAGLSTANRTFTLPDGGALLLTTAVFLDRSGAVYLRGVTPDTLVTIDQDAIDAAASWLRARPR